MKTIHSDPCIDVCNSLLRGEISAIETYTLAIDKFRPKIEASLLENIRRDHVASANRLRENVREMGGVPSNDSGAWGTWAMFVEGAAQLAGDTAALKALLEGEEHGKKEYEDALNDDAVIPGCKEMIRSELLPRQRHHADTLHGLMQAK